MSTCNIILFTFNLFMSACNINMSTCEIVIQLKCDISHKIAQKYGSILLSYTFYVYNMNYVHGNILDRFLCYDLVEHWGCVRLIVRVTRVQFLYMKCEVVDTSWTLVSWEYTPHYSRSAKSSNMASREIMQVSRHFCLLSSKKYLRLSKTL